MDFVIKEAVTKQDKLRFVKSQWLFYKNDPNFVPPIIADRMKLIDTVKNPFYKHAEIKFWTAELGGEIYGRIAAITNKTHNDIHNDKVGFFGFFECINNQSVANALFETAAKWLKEKGMDTMRGPVNPSMNDENAILMDGFDSPPVILMSYNPKYYMDLIENAGLTKAKDLYAYRLANASFMSDKMKRLVDAIRSRYKITIREVNFKNKDQFWKDVATLKEIYNAAWQPNWGFVKMTNEEFDFMAVDLKPIAEQKLAFIAEVDGKPAGFHLGLPDINQAFIYNKKGGMLGAIWHLLTKKKKINMMRIIVLGVLPEYQGKGVDVVMYQESGLRGAETGYLTAEASWILEDNDMMNRGLTQTMNGELYKKYRIYDKSI